MNISIFGMGYVGVVTAAILSRNHKVIGVDINMKKVNMINEGVSPIIEKDVDKLIKEGRQKGSLEATSDHVSALKNTDLTVICVGTPSTENGSHNLTYLENVLNQIRSVLSEKKKYHLIVIRSTIPVGTTEQIIEKYFRGMNIGVCFNPEFLREGEAVYDYMHPPYIVIACNDKKGVELMKEFYSDVKADFYVVPFNEAEILKVVCNVFHALKIVFSNEIGRFCEAYNIDGKRVMDLIVKDKKLNISEKYMKPGFAFGGSCLPKDLRSLQFMVHKKFLDMPLLSSIDKSNDAHIHSAIKKIESFQSKKLGIVGLSFKAGTDDLRESPYVTLVEHFIGKGYDIKIFDKNVSLAKLVGANKKYIEKAIPHISSLLVDNIDELDDRDIIVLNHSITKEFSKNVVDLR